MFLSLKLLVFNKTTESYSKLQLSSFQHFLTIDKTRHVSPRQRSGDSINPIYHSSSKQSAQKDCELYEETTPEPVYQYANAGHEIEAQPPTNVTYDYALPEDHVRIGRRAFAGENGNPTSGNMSENSSELENRENTAHLYHVLESNN